MTKIVKGEGYEIIFNGDDIEVIGNLPEDAIIAKKPKNDNNFKYEFPIREPITKDGLIDVSRYFPKNGNASYSNDIFCLK
jgi:hypothetical protein